MVVVANRGVAAVLAVNVVVVLVCGAVAHDDAFLLWVVDGAMIRQVSVSFKHKILILLYF